MIFTGKYIFSPPENNNPFVTFTEGKVYLVEITDTLDLDWDFKIKNNDGNYIHFLDREIKKFFTPIEDFRNEKLEKLLQ